MESLTLGGPKISNAGLKELRHLESLKTLHLVATKASATGIKELQAALPELKIER